MSCTVSNFSKFRWSLLKKKNYRPKWWNAIFPVLKIESRLANACTWCTILKIIYQAGFIKVLLCTGELAPGCQKIWGLKLSIEVPCRVPKMQALLKWGRLLSLSLLLQLWMPWELGLSYIWNAWCHQTSFEISSVPPFRTLSFLFSC